MLDNATLDGVLATFVIGEGWKAKVNFPPSLPVPFNDLEPDGIDYHDRAYEMAARRVNFLTSLTVIATYRGRRELALNLLRIAIPRATADSGAPQKKICCCTPATDIWSVARHLGYPEITERLERMGIQCYAMNGEYVKVRPGAFYGIYEGEKLEQEVQQALQCIERSQKTLDELDLEAQERKAKQEKATE